MAPETKEKNSTALTIHRPAELLPRAQEMERWFDRMAEDFWRRPFPTLLRPERWRPAETGMMVRMPAVDVYEEKDDVVIKAEIPGLSKEDISVRVTDSTLTIKGAKKREEEVKEDDYYRCERSFGAFTRAVAPPCAVKVDQVKASFKKRCARGPHAQDRRGQEESHHRHDRLGPGQSILLRDTSEPRLMETLVGRRPHKDEGLMPFSAPTYAQARRAFGSLVRAVYRLEVVGADRLPATGPAVVAPNHDSVLDGIVLGAAIARELRFLGKAELWRSRLLAWTLDGLGAIPIERGRGDHLAVARVLQALAAGQAVVIFPQGAVCGDRVWQRGAAYVALVTGAPLVPVRLVGTARALSPGRIGFPRLRVIVGEPIEVARAPEDPTAATELTERLRVAVESLA